jgi:hypothetical protein
MLRSGQLDADACIETSEGLLRTDLPAWQPHRKPISLKNAYPD